MSLRRKSILITTLAVIGATLLLYVVLRALILSSFSGLEQQTTLRNLNRAGNSFQDAINHLQGALADWSSWDDTYEFVQNRNDEYIASNLMDDTFWTLRINLMMFVNDADEIVYARMIDLDNTEQARLLAAFEDTATSDDRFLRLLTSRITAGFIMVGGEPMLIASRPILRSDETGPAAGTLIWARHVNQQELAATSSSLRLTVSLLDTGYFDLPSDVIAAQKALSPASPQFAQPIDETSIAGYALLNDVYDNPSLILRTVQEREIYRQGQATLNYFLIALMLVGTVFGAGALILVDRVVLLPLSNLSERVRYVDVNNDFAMRLPISGRDELTQLALAINTMLSTVSQSRAALQELNVELEQRVMERTTELEDQKSQLQAIMDAMGEGLVYSVDGVIQYVNGAFVELVDYRVRDLVGKPFRSLTSQPNVEPTARRYETALSRSNGTTVQVAVTAMPVEEFDDRQRLVIIVRDITQELKAKAQKEYFFARASHDLRSPLTSIMTRLYLLEKKPEQLETHLKILNRTSERMLELVNDLLDVSRVEQGALVLARRNIVLQSVIEDVVEVQQADAEMRGVRLNLKSDDAPLNVYADPLRINQVVTNLVANAIHYTPEGGRIDVTVERVTVDAAQYAVINVADSGIGISREHLDHIFDPFFRVDGNQENGSGLGLYIVKEIVQLHSGKVSVESEIGKGTTFSVYLTLSSDQSADGETSTEATVSAESAAAIR